MAIFPLVAESCCCWGQGVNKAEHPCQRRLEPDLEQERLQLVTAWTMISSPPVTSEQAADWVVFYICWLAPGSSNVIFILLSARGSTNVPATARSRHPPPPARA